MEPSMEHKTLEIRKFVALDKGKTNRLESLREDANLAFPHLGLLLDKDGVEGLGTNSI